jgi:hypothetical protein
MTNLFMVFRFKLSENRPQETSRESQTRPENFIRKETAAPTRYLVDKP